MRLIKPVKKATKPTKRPDKPAITPRDELMHALKTGSKSGYMTLTKANPSDEITAGYAFTLNDDCKVIKAKGVNVYGKVVRHSPPGFSSIYVKFYARGDL